jgi:hypothetical protein
MVPHHAGTVFAHLLSSIHKLLVLFFANLLAQLAV